MAETENQIPDTVIAQGKQSHPGNGAIAAMPEYPGGETANAKPPEAVAFVPLPEWVGIEPEKPRPPRAEYEVIVSKREEPQSEFMAEHYRQIGIDPSGEGKTDQGSDPGYQPKISAAAAERIKKNGSSKTGVYATIGIGLGLVVGLTIAVLLLHPGSGGPIDMGAVTSVEYGLKGHLTTEWKDERLGYHLTLEPATPAQLAGFVTDVNSSQKPLSITIQAKDPFGEVMCSDTILVKYDPRNAPMNVPAGPQPRSARAAEEIANRNEIARGLKLAQLEGQELDREHGKTLFQSDLGADGLPSSISAQGILRCNKKQVDRFATWSFLTDFPILAKPAVSKDSTPGQKANGNPAAAEEEGENTAEAEKSAAVKAKRKPALPPLPPIYVEGDDQIVWFDAPGGVVETRGGKALILDKGDAMSTTLKGRDLPIAMHYRCNETVGCTFSAVGLGIHHARLRQ